MTRRQVPATTAEMQRPTADGRGSRIDSSLGSLSLWRQGESGHEVDADEAGREGGVLWCDLGPGASADQAWQMLAPLCEGLEREMLDELMAPDQIPSPRSYADGRIKLAGAAAISTRRAAAAGVRDGALIVEPVELLASEEWLVTRWHLPREFQGADAGPHEHDTAPGHKDVVSAVGRKWSKCANARGGGDLGVLIMRELALGYAPAQRELYAWLEDWELELYNRTPSAEELAEQRDALRSLWRLRAVMRDWITPLNIPGMGEDAEKCWLPVSDHSEAIALDDRIDRVLSNLSQLGETLRASFHVVHIEEQEFERRRREQFQHRIEIVAAIFLIPTFIVGLYGANTWLPGEHSEGGFVAMVLIAAALTTVAVIALRRAQKRDRSQAEHKT